MKFEEEQIYKVPTKMMRVTGKESYYLLRIISPSEFDENGEEYMITEIYDHRNKRWLGNRSRFYTRPECLEGMELIVCLVVRKQK
jgi:hypothetical protein